MKSGHRIIQISFLIQVILLPIGSMAQDSLFLRDKTIEVAKILEINSIEISYRRFDYLDGPIFKMEKDRLEKIRYGNGVVEYLSRMVDRNGSPSPNKNVANPEDPTREMCYRNVPIKNLTFWDGAADAERFYKGYKGAGTGSYFAGLLLYYGLPVPIVTSLSAPKNARYFVPDQKLYELNPEYAAGYNHKARRMKQGKAWSNFGYGAGTTVGVSVILVIALLSAIGGN